MSEELAKQEQENKLATQTEAPMGYEDEDEDDLIIPRVKAVQLLSPEFKEKIAEEGDLINSLTKEKLNGKVFIPVYKFTNIIKWKPRNEGGGIEAIAKDGKICVPMDGGEPYPCARLAEFDNSKSGRDAIPTHTKYLNFFGYFEGEPMPIILSFAKTNYKEGKRLYSLAKVTMQNMWNHGYRLDTKKISKNDNEWFNIVVAPNGPTTEEQREFGRMLFDNFNDRRKDVAYDIGDEQQDTDDTMSDKEAESTEY